MTVGERIRKKREELGLSQDELAKKMGYTGKATVSKAERHGDNITTTKVQKYADALGTSFSYLMGWEPDPSNKTEQVVDISKEPNKEQLVMLYLLSLLNKDGFDEAVKRVEELTQLDKYKKEGE